MSGKSIKMTEDAAAYSFPWYTYFTVMSFALGACMGSFLNVCIYRIPRDMATNNPPRSFCPHCKKQIPWYLNIPLLSYTMLGGKCRFCGKKITLRYFLVETLTAMIFLLVWFKFATTGSSTILFLHPAPNVLAVPVYWIAAMGLLLGAFIDIEHMIIPDRVTLGGIVYGLACSAVMPELQGQQTVLKGLLWSAVGACTGWLLLWGVAIAGKLIFKKEAMGFGDVKLLGAIGALLGWQAVIFNIVAASLAGSALGIACVMTGKKEMSSKIPFGPYIAFAAILWILWGPAMWDAYIELMTPATIAVPIP